MRRRWLGGFAAPRRFLVEAVAPAPARAGRPLGERVLWVLELFERIEQRRAGRELEEAAR